ncbi:MAG TPA: TRAP transporter substrate-binding protein DctP [Xanthobacteraceae bacterium]|nr:TRAP transporter substrate-binding protein DctP [Xanthobacteraceae bacterium]
MTTYFARFGVAAALAAFGTSSALPAQAQNMRMLGGWSESNTTAYMPGLQFKQNLDKASGGKSVITISGPEAVPPFEQLQPVSAGAFDMIYTHPTYHSKGLAGIAEILPFGPDKLRSSGVWGFIDEFYQKNHNIKLLALVPVGTEGYHCYLRQPLTAQNDWSGRKLRGVANQHGVIKALGGVPVVMPMGDVYTSIEKGVVDGACAPANVMVATKHHEVAKYRVEPRFGLLVSLIGINLDRWKKLTPEQQKILTDVGIQTEKDTARIGDEILEKENKTLAGLGVQVVQLPKDKGDAIRAIFETSNWGLAEQCCGDAGKQLQELAKKGGLAK